MWFSISLIFYTFSLIGAAENASNHFWPIIITTSTVGGGRGRMTVSSAHDQLVACDELTF